MIKQKGRRIHLDTLDSSAMSYLKGQENLNH